MTHLKRQKMPNTWPLKRKGTKYLAIGINKNSIPAIIFLRDIMKLGENKKEIKKIIHDKMIKINGKIIHDDKYALRLFDVLEIGGKKFKIMLKNKKFCHESANENKI